MSPGNDERPPRREGGSSSRLRSHPDGDTPQPTPSPPADIDLARAHVTAVLDRVPEAAAYDVDLWVRAVLAHLEPLPPNRQWRLQRARHRLVPVSALAPAVARRLSPPAGTQPQPTCPEFCRAQHTEVA